MELLQERRNHNIIKYSNLQHFNRYSKFDLFLQLDIIIQMPSEQNETTSFLQETKHSPTLVMFQLSQHHPTPQQCRLFNCISNLKKGALVSKNLAH